MSENTQMQTLPITLSAEEFIDVRRFVGGMAHDAMKPMCDFLDRKQREAQQIEQARERADAAKADPKPIAAKKK